MINGAIGSKIIKIIGRLTTIPKTMTHHWIFSWTVVIMRYSSSSKYEVYKKFIYQIFWSTKSISKIVRINCQTYFIMPRASLIDYDRKLIITINFKCASTQIIAWFRSNIKNYKHEELRLSKGINRKYTIDPRIVKHYRDYYKIIIVRNPYYRLVSCFLDKGFAQFNPLVELCQKHGVILENLTFRTFVKLIRLQTPDEMDGHWRPYSMRIVPGHYNKIVKLEELDKEINLIAKKFRMSSFPSNKRSYEPKIADLIDVPLKDLKTMDSDAIRNYINYYTLGIQYKVKKLYRQDFIKFGYSVKLLKEN